MLRTALLASALALPLPAYALFTTAPPMARGAQRSLATAIPLAATTQIFDTAWTQSTTYTASDYIANSNATFIQTTPSCISAASGGGPTGTTNPIADGTCSWNWIVTGAKFAIPGNYLYLVQLGCVGSGGAGTNGVTGTGGGGGAYAGTTGMPALLGGALITISMGVASTAGAPAGTTAAAAANGPAIGFGASSLATMTQGVWADGGQGGQVSAGGTGGATANSYGLTLTAGGAGGTSTGNGGGGGGGAAGPDGPGAAGGSPASNGGGGGGAADGGTAGGAGSSSAGGNGGALSGAGSGSGATSSVGGTAGTLGGGSGGGFPSGTANIKTPAQTSGSSSIWASGRGPGGGAGGAGGDGTTSANAGVGGSTAISSGVVPSSFGGGGGAGGKPASGASGPLGGRAAGGICTMTYAHS